MTQRRGFELCLFSWAFFVWLRQAALDVDTSAVSLAKLLAPPPAIWLWHGKPSPYFLSLIANSFASRNLIATGLTAE
jgi:hypothetical protein